MSSPEARAAQLEAAHSLSEILKHQRIIHAFIGGFGIGLLGSVRPTEDIDAMIDWRGLKLYFTSRDPQHVRVTVETLPVGTLGLPPRIITLLSEIRIQLSPNFLLHAEGEHDFAEDLPLLQPSILILTKIKRWATLSESTRLRSISKAQTDLEDIGFLLNWLAQRKEKIDFARYEAAYPQRLFDAVRQLVHVITRDGPATLLGLLVSVLTEEDLAKVKDA